MGWREYVTCKPLFGNDESINKFLNDHPDGLYVDEGYKGVSLKSLFDKYPGVIWYGLFHTDNTCGQGDLSNYVFDCDHFVQIGESVETDSMWWVPMSGLTLCCRGDLDIRPTFMLERETILDLIWKILSLAKELNTYDPEEICRKAQDRWCYDDDPTHDDPLPASEIDDQDITDK